MLGEDGLVKGFTLFSGCRLWPDVFRADSEADEAGEESPEGWVGREEAEYEGWFDGGWIAEDSREEAVDEDLKRLSDASGEFAAVLDACQGEFGDDAGWEDGREDAGGGDGVLDGEVDAYASDGGHGVSGVADAKKAGEVPAGEAVDLDGEKLDLVPVGELIHAGFVAGAAGAEEGDEVGNGGTESWQASRLDFGGEGALGDNEGDLEVFGSIDEDGEVAVVNVAYDVGGVVLVTGEAKPEDVDGHSGLANGEIGGGT